MASDSAAGISCGDGEKRVGELTDVVKLSQKSQSVLQLLRASFVAPQALLQRNRV